MSGNGCEQCRNGHDPWLYVSMALYTLQCEGYGRLPVPGCAASRTIREGHLIKEPVQRMGNTSIVESVVRIVSRPRDRLFMLKDQGYTHGFVLEWFDDSNPETPVLKGHLRLLGGKERLSREGCALTLMAPWYSVGTDDKIVLRGDLDGWEESLRGAISTAKERRAAICALFSLLPVESATSASVRGAIERCEAAGIPLLREVAGVPPHRLHAQARKKLVTQEKWEKAVASYSAAADKSGTDTALAAVAARCIAAGEPCAHCQNPYAELWQGKPWHCFSCKKPLPEVRVGPETTAMAAAVAVDAPLMSGGKLNDEGQRRLASRGVTVAFLQMLAAALPADATTAQVVASFVKPATASRRCRFVELPLIQSYTGQPKAFVSHTWGAPFADLVAAISHVLGKDQCVWLDIFAVRQWPGNMADLNFECVIREAQASSK